MNSPATWVKLPQCGKISVCFFHKKLSNRLIKSHYGTEEVARSLRTFRLAVQSRKKKTQNSHKICQGFFLPQTLQFSTEVASKQDIWTVAIYFGSGPKVSVGISVFYCVENYVRRIGTEWEIWINKKTMCLMCYRNERSLALNRQLRTPGRVLVLARGRVNVCSAPSSNTSSGLTAHLKSSNIAFKCSAFMACWNK